MEKVLMVFVFSLVAGLFVLTKFVFKQIEKNVQKVKQARKNRLNQKLLFSLVEEHSKNLSFEEKNIINQVVKICFNEKEILKNMRVQYCFDHVSERLFLNYDESLEISSNGTVERLYYKNNRYGLSSKYEQIKQILTNQESRQLVMNFFKIVTKEGVMKNYDFCHYKNEELLNQIEPNNMDKNLIRDVTHSIHQLESNKNHFETILNSFKKVA